MTVSQTGSRDAYTQAATAAITRAARFEHDFAGWLAAVLADVAGQLGGADELTAGRPGSWEASFVDQLVKGTVGYGDEYLPGSARGKLTDARARQIKDACRWARRRSGRSPPSSASHRPRSATSPTAGRGGG